MPIPREKIRARLRGGAKAWTPFRDHAALHRGLWVAAPVFWASFAVFLHPGWGAAGFLIHFALCLPRSAGPRAAMLLSFPLLALWFAAREPYLTLPPIPFHRTFAEDSVPVARAGVVADLPVPTARGYTFRFREAGARGERRLLYRVTLESAPGSGPPRWGAAVSLKGRAAPESPPLNPGQLDMRRVLRAQGAAASLRAESWKEIRPPPAWKSVLMHARAALGAGFDRRVPRPALPLLEASLLNITAHVPPETRQAFFRSGMQHILAISGQHIGLLIAFLLFLGPCVRLPRKAVFLTAGILTAAYVPLVGAPVSVVRSGIMLAFLLPAVLLERPSAGLHALCLTASADLLIDPHNVLNLGFQLSYAATLALILGSRPAQSLAARTMEPFAGRGAAEARGKALAGALQMILLGALISLFTYPVLAASTHAATPWGVLGNVVTVPVGAAMLLGGLFTWSFDFLLPARLDVLATWAGAATGLCALLLEGCVFFLARLPGALRPIADPPAAWIAALAAGSLLTMLLLRRERFAAAALCAALLFAAETARPLLSRPGSGEARVTFLAVGHGDAAVLELPGAVILVDAGDAPRVARDILVPFLQSRGIARLDAVLITHPDRDHFGGAAALLDHVSVGRIAGPPEPEDPGVSWTCLRDRARAREVPWTEGRAGQRVHAGKGVSLWILAPDSTLDGGDKNDRSLVALLRTARGNVLLTGDVEQRGQRALASTWPLWRGAWLKAPHHGSDRTTDPCFLRAAAPPRAVVSCGGRRGFPGARTLETLGDLGAVTAVTARHGAITWEIGRRGAREIRHLPAN